MPVTLQSASHSAEPVSPGRAVACHSALAEEEGSRSGASLSTALWLGMKGWGSGSA